MHRLTRVALLIATLIGGWFAQPERAMATPEEFAAGLALIAKDSFNDTSAGIDLIARSGSPHAAAIIEALSDRRLPRRCCEPEDLLPRRHRRHP